MQIFERENGKKYALGRFLRSQRTQRERELNNGELNEKIVRVKRDKN